eukprot:6716877-Prymnesium_polylepis.1
MPARLRLPQQILGRTVIADADLGGRSALRDGGRHWNEMSKRARGSGRLTERASTPKSAISLIDTSCITICD